MIINKNSGKIISHQEIKCRNFLSQGKGLMFKKKQNLLMIFPKEKKIKIHNFFVFYPINVLVLDKEMRIVEIKNNFKPFTSWSSKKKGKFVIELSNLQENKIGEKLELKL